MKHFYIVSVIILTSCASAYIPSFIEPPLFTESKTTKMSAALSTNSIQVQYAHSFINNIAIVSSFNSTYNAIFPTKNINNDIGDSKILLVDFPDPYKHFCGQLGIGYFNSFQKYIFELYAGYGMSYIKDKGIREDLQYDYARYSRPFIRMHFGIQEKNVTYGIGIEQGYVLFNQYFYAKNFSKNKYLLYNTLSYSGYTIQPFCFVKSNFPKWNVGGMVGAQFLIPKTDIDFTRFHMSVSVSYAFDNLSK